MQSIEQHYYRETEEQNSNGCKLPVKKDAMLDSLDAKERSYDNGTNGINFTISEVNLMFVFIVVVWIFFFNKYMIQNPVFFVYNVMLSIVYAIVLWANFNVKLLMSSAKAAVYFEPPSEKAYRSLPECIFLQIKLVKKYMHME